MPLQQDYAKQLLTQCRQSLLVGVKHPVDVYVGQREALMLLAQGVLLFYLPKKYICTPLKLLFLGFPKSCYNSAVIKTAV
ncbi:MAG: hypothetical protein A2096_08080 [Spirochaetes bacterium GWF1_41_5]|nr:MAG: hypothetical protein A2096_08080 [Spirochaetes bacterium GWF1_41_5]